MHLWTDTVRAGRILGTGALMLAALAACSDNGPTEPADQDVSSLLVPAANGWTYVKLGATASVVPVSDPQTSQGWDLAFNATGVMLNGGAAGPGGVQGYCLCQNAGATDQQVKAMKAATELAAFKTATTAQLPAADSAWKSDALVPAITGWYAYNPVAHTIAPVAGRSWVMRTASGSGFAKMRVSAIATTNPANAGLVTLEYAVQSAKGAAMGAVQSLQVDLGSGAPVYVSLARGAVSSAADWDLMLQGYTIRLNGGISGSGRAGAVLSDRPFEQAIDGGEVPDAVFKTDAFGGVFDAHAWYRYNISGQDHQIWPTYNVYFVRRGAEVYKLQIIGYYSAAGIDRNVTFRYAKLAG